MIEWVEFSSQAIKGFPMGDPHHRRFPVYLPPGYANKQTAPYRVVFFLAGFANRGSAYLSEDSVYGLSLPDRFDRAIGEGRLTPFIGVFPDCTSRLGHSQYLNSPSLGAYMDYLCDELVPLIDEKYRTHADARFRILAGHSSGGFGALITGMERPEVFHWLSVSAADSFFEVSLLPGINAALMEVQRAGSVERFLEGVLSRPSARNIGGREFEALLTLALAPCYAPSPGKGAIHGELFFDLQTGSIQPSVWEKYLAWDPVRRIPTRAQNLKKLGFIQLECGLGDEHALQWGHRQIARELGKLGVAHSIGEYSGGHSGHHWRFESRLETLFQKMPKAAP